MLFRKWTERQLRVTLLLKSLGLVVGLTITLMTGCGGDDDGPPGEFRQNFEKPAVDQPTSKEKPDVSPASKALSPRERRAKEAQSKAS